MASAKSSILKVMNTNKLNFHKEAKVEIYLYDIYDNSMNAETQFVDIYVLNKNNRRINHTKDVDGRFIAEPLSITGSYKIYWEVYKRGINKINIWETVKVAPFCQEMDKKNHLNENNYI